MSPKLVTTLDQALAELNQRTAELAARRAEEAGKPGAPQPQLRIPPGDLSLPIAQGGRRQRTLRRLESYRAPMIEGQPAPDTAEIAVWRDERSRKGVAVIASLDHPADHTKLGGPYYLLHVSMSYPDRLPEWWEISAIKTVLYGAHQDACMVLPREADWVNVHDFCFHLWQLPVAWGIK